MPRPRRDASDSNVPETVSFNRDEFLAMARPITEKGAEKVGEMAADWVEHRHQVQHVGFQLVTETAVAIEESSGNNEDGQEAVNQLDAVMRKLIDAEHELTAHEQSLKSLQAKLVSGNIINKLEDAYATNVQETIQTYGTRTSRQKYAKHNDYFKFRERVWEVNHEDAMPPIGDMIPRENADSDAESDIEVGGMTQDYKCPLTLTQLKNPLTSKRCNHSFSGDAIMDYIRSAPGGRKACPASGCSEILTFADLAPNEELAKRVADAARRAKRREEDSDNSDGDVVD